MLALLKAVLNSEADLVFGNSIPVSSAANSLTVPSSCAFSSAAAVFKITLD